MSSPALGPLQGGRRRRRRWVRLAAIVAVLATVAAGAAAYLELDHRGHGGGGSVPVVGAAPTPGAAAAAPHSEPLFVKRAPPPPSVRLPAGPGFHLRMRKPPSAGLVIDLGTGDVLWQRHARRVLPIASLTKIMTALVVTERADPDEPVRITRASLHYSGSGVGVLPKGKRVRLETLMNGMLIVSGNDAAIALADHVAGTERRFVRLMNAKARALGLRCSHFADSYGLNPRSRSCARDLAVLTRLAMANERISRIVRHRRVALRFPIKGGRLFLSGHNPLFRERYPGTVGLKTGFTDQAGRCFVGVARRRGRPLAVILLHSPNPYKHAPALLDAGFRSD
jgi:serine-type D-Ala-D-Ala carboxypeptidase (penicillin-binding protein 5/6)